MLKNPTECAWHKNTRVLLINLFHTHVDLLTTYGRGREKNPNQKNQNIRCHLDLNGMKWDRRLRVERTSLCMDLSQPFFFLLLLRLCSIQCALTWKKSSINVNNHLHSFILSRDSLRLYCFPRFALFCCHYFQLNLSFIGPLSQLTICYFKSWKIYEQMQCFFFTSAIFLLYWGRILMVWSDYENVRIFFLSKCHWEKIFELKAFGMLFSSTNKSS